MLFIVSADSIRETPLRRILLVVVIIIDQNFEISNWERNTAFLRPLKRKRAVPHTSILSIYLFLPPKYTMDRRYIYIHGQQFLKLGTTHDWLNNRTIVRIVQVSPKEKDKKPRIKLNRSIRLLDVLNFNGKRRREKKEEKIPYERRAL